MKTNHYQRDPFSMILIAILTLFVLSLVVIMTRSI